MFPCTALDKEGKVYSHAAVEQLCMLPWMAQRVGDTEFVHRYIAVLAHAVVAHSEQCRSSRHS